MKLPIDISADRVYYTNMESSNTREETAMQYRLIINTGNVHPAKEICNTVESLQKAVSHHLAVGHTIIEVQTRENTAGATYHDWKTT